MANQAHYTNYWVIKKSIEINHLLKMNSINLKLAINISNDTLNNISHHQSFINQINKQSDNSNICFEITDNGLLDFEKSKKLIHDIKKLNYNIAIDDFGTGYCSLECLLHYPFDYIKIDKTFIDNIFIPNDEIKNQKILINIIKFSKSLGSKIIAEGVETKKQLSFLKKHGCHIVQGYYYSKPLKLTEFLKFYHSFNQNK